MASRTTNSIKNIIFSLAFQLVTLILSFVNRTVFIWILGVNYLGISGLFSDILSMLSLADLGIGASLVFSLYKPIADKDYEKQNIIKFSMWGIGVRSCHRLW